MPEYGIKIPGRRTHRGRRVQAVWFRADYNGSGSWPWVGPSKATAFASREEAEEAIKIHRIGTHADPADKPIVKRLPDSRKEI